MKELTVLDKVTAYSSQENPADLNFSKLNLIELWCSDPSFPKEKDDPNGEKKRILESSGSQRAEHS